MKKFLVPSIVFIFCSCGPQTPADCKADYNAAMDQCDQDEADGKAKLRKMKDRCNSMQDPQAKDKCMQDVQKAEDRLQMDKKSCKDKAKSDRESCKEKVKGQEP